jgi:tetratricopeptide (TPR) repeat protein
MSSACLSVLPVSAVARGETFEPTPRGGNAAQAEAVPQSGGPAEQELVGAPTDFKPRPQEGSGSLVLPRAEGETPTTAPDGKRLEFSGFAQREWLARAQQPSDGPANRDGSRNSANMRATVQVWKAHEMTKQALSCYERGLKDRALDLLGAALLEAEYSGARMWRAQILAERRQFQRAIQDLDCALALNPMDIDAMRLRASTGMELTLTGDESRLERALSDADLVLRLQPEDVAALTCRGTLAVHRKDYDRGIADLTRVVSDKGTDLSSGCRLWALMHRGLAYMMRRNYQRAITDLDEAARRSALDWEFLACRGECRFHTGDLERAIADFTAAIRVRPDKAWLDERRAASYDRKHDLDRCLSDRDQVVRISPSDPLGYFHRLSARIQKNDVMGAMADMDRIVQLDPREAGPYTYRAVLAWLLLRDRDRALADLDRAVSIDPRLSLHYALRGCLRAGKHQFGAAFRDLGLCVLAFDLVELKPYCRVDIERRRFKLGVNYEPREATAADKPGPAGAGLDGRCIDSSIECLARAAWRRSDRRYRDVLDAHNMED